MIWFTSDTHFGHKNMVSAVSTWPDKWGCREFDSVHDMNKILTATFNKYAKEGDILYHLGDFCFGGHQNTPTYRHSLVCQNIYMCRGNHDSNIDKYADLFKSIEDTQNLIWKTDHNNFNIFMSHYSHRVWEGSHKGYIHLYGHSHGTIPDHGKSMDVGVDVAFRMFGEYRPFSIEEIISIMNKKRVAFVDGHNSETNVK